MRAHVVIGFLLSCTAAALPVAEDNGEIFMPEVEVNPQSLISRLTHIFDDDGNQVDIDLTEDDPETEEETLKDLTNRVFFYLHTRKSPSEPKPLHIDDKTALKKSGFDASKPTRLITHGWINSRKSAACHLIRDAYIKHGDYNVIVVDWSKISFRPYVWASRRVKMVGQHVSKMVNFLAKQGMDLSQTAMVGHSLGAHVMGLAGHYASGTVQLIFGLDPALPTFQFAGRGSRISIGDAKYVEIIHTNAGLLGFLTAIGDADFYPNGGSKQHGCLVDPGGACSHARSFHFFAESINSPVGFHAHSCSSYAKYKLGLCRGKTILMGGHKDNFKGLKGSYFLDTKAATPFAKGI